MRKRIIAGNWKLNKTNAEAIQLVQELKALVTDVNNVEMVVCPTAVALQDVAKELKGSNIGVGAQNMWHEDSGAFTGEISAPIIQAVGAAYVILGHSERRQFFGEDNAVINQKVHKALSAGLVPIVCVGELLEERESGITEAVVRDHVMGSLEGVSAADMPKVVLAYEPVWAIGTGKTATPEQAQDVHAFIRGLLVEAYGQAVAEQVRIQYGGSVKPDNAEELLGQADIDGALVGGASLKAADFAAIIKA